MLKNEERVFEIVEKLLPEVADLMPKVRLNIANITLLEL